MQRLSLGKKKKKKKAKKSATFSWKVLQIFYALSFSLFSLLFTPLRIFTQAKQQEGPLMNVADRHGYGSEMQQKAIMVGHRGEKGERKKKKEREMHLFVRISEQL